MLFIERGLLAAGAPQQLIDGFSLLPKEWGRQRCGASLDLSSQGAAMAEELHVTGGSTWPRTIAIIGCGTMGVAESFILAGRAIRLLDMTPELTPEAPTRLVDQGRSGTKAGIGVFTYTAKERDQLLLARDRAYAALGARLAELRVDDDGLQASPSGTPATGNTIEGYG